MQEERKNTFFLSTLFFVNLISFRSSEQPAVEEEKDNMQITITGEKVEEDAGSGRKVARDVDINNFTVLDQVIWIKK